MSSENFPVQLVETGLKEFSFSATGLFDSKTELKEITNSDICQLIIKYPRIADSEFSDLNKRIVVDLAVYAYVGYQDMGDVLDSEPDIQPDPKQPYSLKIVQWCKLVIDLNKISIDLAQKWLASGSRMIVYPYIREHVYSLTLRAGVKPVILPLITIPTKIPSQD